ncbi:MAG: type III-A CRISPR-associated RAMP protein Csm5 [Thermoplasmatales archaeon]
MKLTISVKTPLIIGGTDEIQEFDIFEKNGKAYVVDVVATSFSISKSESDRWFSLTSAFIKEKGKPGYRNYAQNVKQSDPKDDIQLFLSELYNAGKLKLFEPSIDIIGKGFRDNGPVKPTMYYFDAQDRARMMTPYIPGSSIKGAIRKAILYRLIRNGVSVLNQGRQQKIIDILLEDQGKHQKYLSDSPVFSYEPKNMVLSDIMKFLVVTDFLPQDDVLLALFQISGKVRKNEVKTTHIGIASGTFVGNIGINRSLFPVLKGVMPDAQSERLRKILGLLNLTGFNTKDMASLERSMVMWILESVDMFSRDNGKATGYIFDDLSKFIILGQGKGAPLTTVINASPEIIRRVGQRRVTDLGKGGLSSLARPKTRSEVEIPGGKVRPGMCTVEVVK